jgi:hypothetical protein
MTKQLMPSHRVSITARLDDDTAIDALLTALGTGGAVGMLVRARDLPSVEILTVDELYERGALGDDEESS